MGKIYDDWERLVMSVTRRERDRMLALTRYSSPSSSSSSSSHLSFSSTSQPLLLPDPTTVLPTVTLHHNSQGLEVDASTGQNGTSVDIMVQSGSIAHECFYLDGRTGKNCFLVGAWSLTLGTMADNWINSFHPQSRFSDAAELTEARHLYIEGNIKTKMLSPETSYAAYLVYGFAEMYANLRSAVSIIRKNSYHESSGDDCCDEQAKIVKFQEGDGREDGWMEIQIGEFYVDFGDDGELQVQLLDTSGKNKSGLIVEGIEFRPKHS